MKKSKFKKTLSQHVLGFINEANSENLDIDEAKEQILRKLRRIMGEILQ
ncbi:hypothetical protein [Bacillus sp. M6-12]|nr:hypothetical protein [Bacillus sp. M6-12]